MASARAMPSPPSSRGLSTRQLARAAKKFAQADVDENGRLQGQELRSLAAWLFASFNPGGTALSDDAVKCAPPA